MLKLFRDYLFHAVTEDGLPWLDHAHIVQCLNKLDAGTMEKVNGMHLNIIKNIYHTHHLSPSVSIGAINVQRRAVNTNCYLR